MTLRHAMALAMLALAPCAAASAQPPRPAPRAEAPADPAAAARMQIAEGWRLLAEGQIDQAIARAAQMLGANPRSAAALTLAVEARIAGGGAAAGLTQYEAWLGARTLEEPGVLRRIAFEALVEQSIRRDDARARLIAVEALNEDGYAPAVAEMSGPLPEPGSPDLRERAALGDESAVKELLKTLSDPSSAQVVLSADALGRSKSRTATEPLVRLLSDPRTEVRATAAEALGRLGNAEVVPKLAPLLQDRNVFVRVRAAGALYRLGDQSGAALLATLAGDQTPSTRLEAARALAGQPDATWLALVRELTNAADPEVRVGAAQLLAPHDPAAAQAVLDAFANDPNPALRELAGRAYADVASESTDLTALRRLLKSAVPITRASAGARILRLTR